MTSIFAPGTGLRRYTRKHLRHDLAAARAEVLRLEAVVRGLDGTVHEQGKCIADLEARNERQATEIKAHRANAVRVTVRRWERPVDPDDQPTVPAGTPVLTLRQAFNPDAA